MSDYHINIFYSDEDAAYVADIPDLDSCSATGRTPEEGLAAGRGRQGSLAGDCARRWPAGSAAAISSGDLSDRQIAY